MIEATFDETAWLRLEPGIAEAARMVTGAPGRPPEGKW
jgi:hypothetical protein